MDFTQTGKSMVKFSFQPNRAIWLFLLKVAIIYTVLLLPWLSLRENYGHFFRHLCRLVLVSDTGKRELTFLALPSAHGMTQTRIEIVNRSLMSYDGSGPVRNLDIDHGGFYRVSAFLSALVLATPMPGLRRIYALFFGWASLHGFILLTVAFAIRNESRYVALVNLNAQWQEIADKFQHFLIAQISIAIPVLIWLGMLKLNIRVIRT